MLFKLMADSEHVQRFEFLGPLSRFFWAVDQSHHHDGPTNLVVENEKCRTRTPYYSLLTDVFPVASPLRVKHGTHYFVRQLHYAAGGGSGITHAIYPCIALGTVEARAAVGLIEKL